MKYRLFTTFLLLIVVAVLGACSPTFPLVQDTRTPTPPIGPVLEPVPDATLIAGATLTAEVTPTLVITPTVVEVGTAVAPTAVAPTPVCDIKGNITATGEKIYHVPGQATYGRTKIDPSAGEEWLCSEAEAVAKGYRKAIR